MVKSVIKEIFIMILLCIAIALILGILFYDYIPTNKIIPSKEAYHTPDEVKTEIDEQITEIEKTEISYEVTDADLNVYKQTSSYRPGKPDPFSLTETQNNTAGNSNTLGNTGTQGNGNNQGQNNTTKPNENSTGTFFNDEGIK